MTEIVAIRFSALGEKDETRPGTLEGSANDDESFRRHVASRGGISRGE